MAPVDPTTSAAPYTVLARRFRPQTFSDVVGQEHVGQAIQNAIKTGRVAHAYLFTGARGVGKTSTARIFAKALNCAHLVDGIPCNECDICQSIATGQDVDVLEIDGASNRGIDDIRQLRANVNVKSMRSKNKVYIIDEVHMLTKEAFNALLKTLEEPPPNVKFIFCTTEPNKVPDTILSRCQRFDFGTIATDRIALRLTQIAEAEGMTVDAEAVELVARRAAGSMRDSQSLFDQLLAFGEEHITTDDVHRLLGTAPDERLVLLVDNLIAQERGAALNQLEEAVKQGAQLGPFSDQLLEYLRDLLIVLSGADQVPLLSVSSSLRDLLLEQGRRWGMYTVAAAMQILAETKGKMQRVNYGRALVELALVRISLLSNLDDITQFMQQCRSGLPSSAGVAAGNVPPPARPTPLPAPEGATGTTGPSNSGTTAVSSESSTQGNKLREEMARRLEAKRQREAATPINEGTSPQASIEPAPQAQLSSPPPTPEEEADDRYQSELDEPASSPTSSPSSPPLASTSTTANPTAVDLDQFAPSADLEGNDDSTPPTHPDPPFNEGDNETELTDDIVESVWGQMLAQAPDKLANHLKNADCPTVSGKDTLALRFPAQFAFSVTYCQRPESLAKLEELAGQIFGRPISIKISTKPGTTTSSTASTTPQSPHAPAERLRPSVVEEDEFVQAAVAIFNGNVVDVRKMPPPVEVDHSHDATDNDADVE